MSGRAMDSDDASIADLPWASVFDPANNVRALGAIQDRGFRAATDVVSRFVQMTDRGLGAVSAPSSEKKPEDGSAATYPDLGRILTSLQSIVSQLGQSVLNNAARQKRRSIWSTPHPAARPFWRPASPGRR